MKYHSFEFPNHRKPKTHFLFEKREKQFQKFLFYKYFFVSPKPVIITEGKTDVIYLKAALRKLYNEYPDLVEKKKDGSFEYKISFFNFFVTESYIFSQWLMLFLSTAGFFTVTLKVFVRLPAFTVKV